MTFIPANQEKVGARVRLIRNVEVLAGTFTAGHEFTIESSAGQRGWNLIDDEGNRLTEVGVWGGIPWEVIDTTKTESKCTDPDCSI